MQHTSYLVHLFKQTLSACSPEKAISEKVSVKGDNLQVGESSFVLDDQPIFVLAVGKASVEMYEAVHDLLGDQIAGSLVITPDADEASACRAEKVVVGSHPVPDEQSLEAGRAAVNFLRNAPENVLLLSLISGGTSSLMCLPAENISIEDLNKTYDLLNRSGTTIHEINTVRKHCSQIKDGQLLEFLPTGATIIDLLISDVPGDDPGVIGSGPTTPDYSTFQDTYHILLEYELWESVPRSIRIHIEKGLDGEEPEILRPEEDPVQHQQYIISSAGQFAQRAAEIARTDGYTATVADEPFNEDVEEVATRIAGKVLPSAKAQATVPLLFVFYGESTVQVTGDGKGGRNQELALRGALKIAEHENISWLSAGTDGIDGPTDAAGAVVDSETIRRARELGMDPHEYLQNNDAYHFHEQLDTLVKTGPTGNNLMDVVFVAVDS